MAKNNSAIVLLSSLVAVSPFASVSEAKGFLAGFLAARKVPAEAIGLPEAAIYDRIIKPRLISLVCSLYGENAHNRMPLGILVDAAINAAKRTIDPIKAKESLRVNKGSWVALKLSADKLTIRDWLARQHCANIDASESLRSFTLFLDRARQYEKMAQSKVDTTPEQSEEYAKQAATLLHRAKVEASEFIGQVCKSVRYFSLIETVGYDPEPLPWDVWGLESPEVQNLLSQAAYAEEKGETVDRAQLLELVMFYLAGI